MRELQQVQFVTRYFARLQGLRTVPIGLIILVNHVGQTAWVEARLNEMLIGAFGLIVTLGAVLMLVLTERYYRERFGQVRPIDAPGQRQAAMLVLAIVATLVLLLVLDRVLRPSASLKLWVLGIAFLPWGWTPPGPERWISTPLGLALLMLNTLALFGVIDSTRSIADSHWPSVAIGGVMVFSGLYRHWLLVRTLHPLPEEDNHAIARS